MLLHKISVSATRSVWQLFAIAAPLCVVANVRAIHGNVADGPRIVANFLKQAEIRDMNVFVYDYQPVIYALAQIRPRTRYVLGSELTQFNYSAKVDGVTEVKRLMDELPDFVVLRTTLPGEAVPEELDALMAQRLASYHMIREVSDGADRAKVLIYSSKLLSIRDRTTEGADRLDHHSVDVERNH
jgi:hypothetical protein